MDKKTESLVILSEECSEVIQAATKYLRWGPNSSWDEGLTNREQLILEMGDVMAVITITALIHGIDLEKVYHAADDKFKRLEKYSNLFKKE